MDDFQFNGLHLAITVGALAFGFVTGAVWGWLFRDDRSFDECEGCTGCPGTKEEVEP